MSSAQMPTTAKRALRVLCLGDVVGGAGREALKQQLPRIKQVYNIDFTIANGENSAGGFGLTPATAKEMRSCGVDVITTGNHIWRYKECYDLLDKADYVIRPGNFSTKAPGKGLTVVKAKNGCSVAVINLAGRIFMDPADCPFATVESLLHQIPQEVRVILVDFHAEASSEKRALFLYLDGRVSAAFGTHTHVQTADALILSQGTACLTDLGMCGAEETSIIGMEKEAVIKRFVTGIPSPFKPAKGPLGLNGAIINIDMESGRALSISLLRRHSVFVGSSME